MKTLLLQRVELPWHSLEPIQCSSVDLSIAMLRPANTGYPSYQSIRRDDCSSNDKYQWRYVSPYTSIRRSLC